jgi:hypothetical protein
MGRDGEGAGEADAGWVFAFIGPCRRPGVGRRPSGRCDRRECCEGELQKDGEVGGASRAPTAAVGGQPLLRGPDGRNRQRSRGPKGGAPGERPDCAYASATDVRCIPHRGWRVPAT